MRIYRNLRGFTLIETVLFIIIVGIAVAAIGTQFATNVSRSHEPVLRQRALAVATAYMDEILRKRWNENTPPGGGCVDTTSGSCTGGPTVSSPTIGNEIGESGTCPSGAHDRVNYDDVDDYNALSAGERPTESSGCSDMPGYENFTVTVSVTQPDAPWEGISNLDVRKIDVSVDTPDGQTIALSAYRINY